MTGTCSRHEVPGPVAVPIIHPLMDRFPGSLERTECAPSLTGTVAIGLVGGTQAVEYSNGTTNMGPWRCTVLAAGISANSIRMTLDG
jgi:hypothetical protein